MDYLSNLLTVPNIVAFLSLLVAVITARYAFRNRIQLRILFTNIREIGKLSDSNRKIKVYYENQEVVQVTTSKAWFWNRGKRPLKREDIPENDPLRILIKGRNDREITILDFKVLKTSNDSSNFELQRTTQPNVLDLNFDYIDSQGGAFFEIQHSGNENVTLDIAGVILGPKGKTKAKKFSSYYYTELSPFKATVRDIGGIVVLFLLAGAAMSVISREYSPFALMGIGCILFFLLIFFKFRHQYPRTLSIQKMDVD